MFRSSKVSSSVGAVGAVLIAAHVVLGAAVMPVAGVVAGLALVVVAAGLHMLTGRSSSGRARRQADAVGDRHDG
jgi:hypothetical protein